jgi:hypothetical protein
MPQARVHARDVGVTRLDVEEVSQERHHLAEIVTETMDAAVDLLHDDGFRVAVIDAEHSLDHLDHRVKRHRPAERQRMTLDPHRGRAELAPEFVQQP